MKKALTFLLFFGLMFFLAACSDNSGEQTSDKNNEQDQEEGDNSGQVEIEFWTMQLSPTFDDYINGVIEDFEAENPNIKVKWVDVPWADMEKKILSAVASETAPDVANLNPQFASKLAELDALVNMDEAVPADIRDDYFEGVWKSNTFNGKTFGIPWYLSTQLTMYNADMFEAAGLDPDNPPKTFDEVYEVAETMKEETGKYAFFPPLDGSHLLETMVMMGADLTNEDMTRAAFNSSEGKKAFQFLVDLYQNELIPREALTEGHGKAIDMYQAGELAILASGPQFLNTVKENAPEILEATRSSTQITGKTGKMKVDAMNLVVPKQSNHQEEAVKFALFITNAENQIEFDKIVPILPSIESALDDPFFNELPENPTPIDRARIVSASQLKNGEVLVPPMKNYEDLKTSIFEALQAAMLGEMTIDEALDQAEQEWNEILSN
ncbi:carbohydrate ABC transporter substrate-binding protein (CUT1 family) [Melghiribacillus thermohalophilus]|uniref:Carbohydrate ABC transporter substrate-binding protein (CUT1 family) n=1 Tax=Melghiribacillus thermohalophilus TaxID=1324956 RepID=A0A4R3MYK1_9BACI|nr:ABC transporter substrate-binding protein [Melghiribacillus thermohalophilus]TCT21750.1 carbohydrate ABC transporter substrate-binding protein (CUT1 family) [Melghiribacillus thermohalophilus]